MDFELEEHNFGTEFSTLHQLLTKNSMKELRNYFFEGCIPRLLAYPVYYYYFKEVTCRLKPGLIGGSVDCLDLVGRESSRPDATI